ncbi:hypothetical protein [Pseudoalteromonas luteoviolacea]|uniref:Uncharacterized protein n=1 Tax=Pseudoalteromonas luteoviolacea S4054 TaxID=1129367 RepID=A0A0F6AHW1_9GAMM|nr:hypothetical protein [Pseudoalteromonas luteoviolacea]AOT09302.1 hypothetical protein S4054249_16250 [Pseudoalteromonas luteoviolacea]AOT14214.1 hypothetical protein S40542_16220 [Pseudoalteromonas luteoviolacea]AOT19130.1 hypothetical protein S4054_16225 [Pseudoalteromonas luteoviolacea]KKE84979.1 hypothetical protein N479_05990 [Pseudoalteromonas luteoviolacea S4054]KZN70097.1 hypothetical protein N481_01100 [Pseudoalteromonas luteoviolacea S4047-1]
MLLGYIFVIALIKASLLGLGVISIAIALSALLVIKFAPLTITPASQKQFNLIYKVALFGHLSAYAGLLLKAFFIDGMEDIPAFIVSHLVLHHLLCAAVAGVATFMALRIFIAHRSKDSSQLRSNL